MALTTLSLLVLAQQYAQDLVRQANRRAVTLSVLRKTFGAGKNVPIPVEFDGQVAAAYGDGEDVPAGTFAQDAQAAAVLQWGLYESGASITNLAVDAAASTSAGPAGNEDAWGRQLFNAATKLCSVVNIDLYQGTGTSAGGKPNIVGFGEMLGSVSNTYATLDRSNEANALWRPNVFDPGSATELTIQMIRQDLAAQLVAGGVEPDVAFCTPAVFNTAAALTDPLRRFETDTINTVAGEVKLAYKVSAFMVDNTTFIKDKDAKYSTDSATVGSITYVNSDLVDLQLLMPALNRQVYQQLVAKGLIQANDGMQALQMALFYELLAKTGSANKGRVALTAQLRCLKPNAMGIRSNIAIKNT